MRRRVLAPATGVPPRPWVQGLPRGGEPALGRPGGGLGNKSCNLSTIAAPAFSRAAAGLLSDGGARSPATRRSPGRARDPGSWPERAHHHTRVGVGGAWTRCNARWCWQAGALRPGRCTPAALGERYALIREAFGPDSAAVQLLAVRPDRDSSGAQYTVLVNDRPAVQAGLIGRASRPRALPKPLHHSRPMPPTAARTTIRKHPRRAARLSLPMRPT